MKIKLSTREKWLLFFAIVMAGVYSLYTYAYLPMYEDIISQQKNLVQKRMELRIIKEKIKLMQDSRISAVGKLRIRGKEEQVVEAIHYLSQEISRLKLDLKNIIPRSGEIGALAAKAAIIDLKLVGDYNSIYRFLYAIERLPIFVSPGSLVLVRLPNSTKVSAALSLRVYY
jgi:hypothetical protein